MDCDGYSFETFEVLIEQRLLRQGAKRLKIQELPFRMLLVLLEKPGEIVSKSELTRKLWGEGRFVQGDSGLYVVAARLREVLDDDPVYPRFVETISGRGYRFVVPVTPIKATPELGAAREPPPSPLHAVHPPPPWEQGRDENSVPAIYAGRVLNRTATPMYRLAAIAAAIFVCVAGGMSIYKYEHRPLLYEQDKVVIGSFSNGTGNPNLDETLSSTLRNQMQESPYLTLIPERKFRTLVKDLASASLQDELRACATLDARVLVTGRISAAPEGYQVALKAWRCSTGELLTTQDGDAGSEAAVLPAVDVAVGRMRRRLGESEATLRKFNVPAVQATTASLAALKAFNFATEKDLTGDESAAIASYKLAIDIDPQFALAFARLGMSYYNSGQFALGARSFERAFELRNSRASDYERLYIVSHYYEFATGQIQRAIEVNELWHTLYPRDTVPMHNLAAKYVLMGRPEPALALAQEAIQEEPNTSRNYDLLAVVYVSLGRYADVLRLCHDPLHGNTKSVGFHQACFDAAFASDDEVAMQRALQSVRGTAEESELIADSAWGAMYHGKLSQARMLFQKAEQTAKRSKVLDLEADIGLDEGMLEAEVGSRSIAEADVERILQLPFESASEQAYAARVLARSGDASKALLVANKAASTAPLDDLVNSAMLPTVTAAIKLQEANPKGALDALEPRDFDLCCRILVAGYYRGLAYLEMKQPELAKREFQNVIDHRFLSASFSIYLVLSELELGHVCQLLGDSANANAAFAKVDLAWKGADPSFPPLAKLRQYRGLPPLAK